MTTSQKPTAAKKSTRKKASATSVIEDFETKADTLANEVKYAIDGIPYNPELGDLNEFRNFVYLVFKHLRDQGDEHMKDPTDVQYDIAKFLQYGPKRSIVMAFRGVGKSYITAAFVCWLWLLNPHLKILVVSATLKKSTEFLLMVKSLINTMPLLEGLKPQHGQKNSEKALDVGPAQERTSQSNSLKCVGVLSSEITGSRADIIIADDVEIRKNSNTIAKREELAGIVKEFDNVLKKGLDHTKIIYLGTPQTENSLYMDLSNKGFELRIWPARYPESTEVYKGRLAPMITEALDGNPALIGKPTDPRRFNEIELTAQELANGRSDFRMQMMLDPSLSDENRYPLKLRDFIVAAINAEIAPVNMAWSSDQRVRLSIPCIGMTGDFWTGPIHIGEVWENYSGRLMAIDPSGRGADETAYAVVYFLKGFLFLAEWGGFKGGYEEETLKQLAGVALKHKVNTVLVESNFGDGMWNTLFSPILLKYHKCALEEIRSTTMKEMRICDTLEPVLSGHRLVISEQVILDDAKENTQKQGLYQLTRMTRERGALKFDDRIDVLAMAVAFFRAQMGFDIHSNEAAIKLAEHQARINRLYNKILNKDSGQKSDFIEEGDWFKNMDAASSSRDEDEGPWWKLQ